MFLSPGSRAGRRMLLPPARSAAVVGTRNEFDLSFVPNSLSALTLSNDVATPNSVLDIAAGACTDSTNAYLMKLTSTFTKSTAGTWIAGSGASGMGTGLTIAASTWYHVFLITTGRSVDAYFDTSATAANKPAGTVGFRRIGSFKTDGASLIIAFTQRGNEFLWTVPVLDVAAGTAMSTTGALQTLTVPTSIQVNAMFGTIATFNTAGNFIVWTSPDQTNTAASTSFCNLVVNTTTLGSSQFNLRTNTSGQVRQRIDSGDVSMRVLTSGWIDMRGQDG